MKLGTSSCVNYSIWNPKHSAKYVNHSGTLASCIAKRNRGEQELCPVHHGSPLDSQLLQKERTTPRAPLREEARGSRVLHREFAQEEMQEVVQLGYPRPVGQGDGVPKAGPEQAAVDSRGSRTCVCAITLFVEEWHTQGGKDELTSCRGTV